MLGLVLITSHVHWHGSLNSDHLIWIGLIVQNALNDNTLQFMD